MRQIRRKLSDILVIVKDYIILNKESGILKYNICINCKLDLRRVNKILNLLIIEGYIFKFERRYYPTEKFLEVK